MSTLVLLNSDLDQVSQIQFYGQDYIILYRLCDFVSKSLHWCRAKTALSTQCTKVAKDRNDATPYQPTTLWLLHTILNCIFSAPHVMPVQTNNEKGVRLSNVWTLTKQKKDLSSLVFREQEWLVGGDPFYLKFVINWHPPEWNCRSWTDIRS